MYKVKVYSISTTKEEEKWSREQCEYLKNQGDKYREAGPLNVKFLLADSYENGIKNAFQLITKNLLFEYGLIVVGNEHLNRRLWTVVDKIANEVSRQRLNVYISLNECATTTMGGYTAKKIEIKANELVPKYFYLNLTNYSLNRNILGSCLVSRTFFCTPPELNAWGNVEPPLSVNVDVFKTLPFVHYSHERRDYIRSLSMVHYCPKRKESLFNDTFDGVYCINLSSRPDRMKRFEQKMKLHNISFERFNAVSKTFLTPLSNIVLPDDPLMIGSPNRCGLLGCLLSHMSVMKIALSRGQKQILIFEDDVSIHKDAEELFGNFLKSLKENNVNVKEIDVMHLGYLPVVEKGTDTKKDIWSYCFLDHYKNSGNLLKSRHFIGCHAYAVSEKFMKAYIDFYANLDAVPPNGQWQQSNLSCFLGWPTNDWAVRNFFIEDPNNTYKCFAPCPQIFSVSPSVSDNSGLTEEDDIECRVSNANFTYYDDYE